MLGGKKLNAVLCNLQFSRIPRNLEHDNVVVCCLANGSERLNVKSEVPPKGSLHDLLHGNVIHNSQICMYLCFHTEQSFIQDQWTRVSKKCATYPFKFSTFCWFVASVESI